MEAKDLEQWSDDRIGFNKPSWFDRRLQFPEDEFDWKLKGHPLEWWDLFNSCLEYPEDGSD